MRFGICAPYRQVAALKPISFEYLEENVQRFLIPDQPQDVFADLLGEARTLSVPIEAANSFIPADLALIETPEQRQHGEDFRPAFSVLQRSGYDRRISIECRWGDLAAKVDPAIATLREQWGSPAP